LPAGLPRSAALLPARQPALCPPPGQTAGAQQQDAAGRRAGRGACRLGGQRVFPGRGRGCLQRAGVTRPRAARRTLRAAGRTARRADLHLAGGKLMGQSFDLLSASFDGRTLIEASAGTGKTWTLTALYARLLLERQLSVGQILVVTYTTAATAELRERIRARLADLLAVYDGTPSDDDFLNRLHARYPDEASRRRLLLAVHGFDEAA